MKLSLVCVPLALLACNRTPEPEPMKPAPPASSSPAPSAAPSASAASSQLTWDVPKGWTKSDKPSPMRKATYVLPKQAGDMDPPELAISVAGGSVDANVDRWVQQFDEESKKSLKKSSKKVGAWDVTIAELTGSWMGSGMTAGGVPPKHGYKMVAAIVPVSDDAKWFFKLIGPEKSVEAARGDFNAFIGSVRPQ